MKAPLSNSPPGQPPPGQHRRARERAERERVYLDIARKLLLRDGYLGLTMDRVAALSEYSKGTLYQHFRNKEELVVCLSEQITRAKAELFERALGFAGRPRERILAVGIAYQLWAGRYPDDIRVTQVLKSRSLSAKVRPELQRAMQEAEARCCGVLVRLTEEGIAAGDLQLPLEMSAGQLVFGLWALCFGGWLLALMDFDLSPLQVLEAGPLVQQHAQKLLDGHGWRPLSGEWDYAGTTRRALRELFPDFAAPNSI